MSRFNRKTPSTKTHNLAGGQAFSLDSKLEFVTLLLTSFLKDKFYEGANEQLDRLVELCDRIPDKTFLAKAAIYARTKYGMRSVSHVVAGEIAHAVKGEQWTKGFFNKVIFRADDPSEILSYYCTKYGKPIPNCLKKGIALSLQRFNAYELAKYRGEGKTVRMVDLVNLTHPIGNPELTKLIKGELKNTQTWEAKLTEAGKKAENEEDKVELKEKAWKELILEKKLGYFALLRNLRNIIEQAPEVLPQALEMLVDEKAIKSSLVLPFRFTTALKALEEINPPRSVVQALSKAVDISLQNVPKLPGKTCVILDCSGSMQGQPEEIGALFSAVLYKANDADLIVFSDVAEYRTPNPDDSTLTIVKSLAHGSSGGTNFHAPFEIMNKKYDRLIFLSDMQGWIGYDSPVVSANAYNQKFGAFPTVFSFDLAGHGTVQFPQPKINCLAGFSDKTMDVMALLESDKNALINEIEKIEL